MSKSYGTLKQPTPVCMEQSEEVLPWTLELLLPTGRGLLAADLQERIQMGTEHYGTPLMSHNGRDTLVDLYQELLDALNYLAQYQMESGEDIAEQFVELRHLAMWVKTKLEYRDRL